MDNGDWQSLPLSPAQTEIKYHAILSNQTQTTTREFYLVSFARNNELFATIVPERVPFLPAGTEPDWQKAVRAKMLTIIPADYRPRFDPPPQPAPTRTIPLETIDFVRQNGDLVAIIGLRNRIGKRSGVHLTLFPYQHGVPFATMPKVEVSVPPLWEFHVLVDGMRLQDTGVKVISIANRIIIRVPMRLLGGTGVDHVFAAAQAHWGEIAADDTAWQLLDLTSPPEGLNHD